MFVYTCSITIIRQNQSSTESESESLSLNFFKKLSPIIIYALAWHIARDTPLLAIKKYSSCFKLFIVFLLFIRFDTLTEIRVALESS